MTLPRPPWIWPRATYIHIPFCAHHCGYCDFAVVAGRDHQIDLYLEALSEELASLGQPQSVKTLFLGGGTPSHLNSRQLQRLFAELRRWLPLEPGGEFSLEANPESLDRDKIALLAEAGVNRLSLGAQSFKEQTLRTLDRPHSPAEVARAVTQAREMIPVLSLDLIFGVPAQTLEDWRQDLQIALELGLDHISTYGLTYEKGTPLWKSRQRGEIQALSEDEELAMYSLAIDLLESAGFRQYEISNFARPGRECRHNQVYWANEAYFGFGLGAARYVEGRRELNTRNLTTYLRRCLSGQSPTFQSECLEGIERARETLAVQLRRAEGIQRQRFREQTSFDLDSLAGQAIARQVELGLLHDDGQSVTLSRAGKYVADAVIAALL